VGAHVSGEHEVAGDTPEEGVEPWVEAIHAPEQGGLCKGAIMMENREDAEVGKGREADEKEGGEGCKDQVGKYTCVCVCMCMRA